MKFLQKFNLINLALISLLFSTLLWSPKSASALIANGAMAVNGLGQYDWVNMANLAPVYTTGTAGSAPNRIGYNTPSAVTVDSINHRLFVADSANNRILIYNLNSDGTLVDQLADNVLGQVNFYSRVDGSAEPSATSMGFIAGMAYDPTTNYLYTADSTTNRVAVYDVATITNGEAAIRVLGQPDLISNVLNGVSDVELSNPTGLALDTVGQRLFVADTAYNRVLVFDIATISNGEAAIHVLGQADFVTDVGARTQSRVNQPAGLAYDPTGSRLFVGDMSNQRVLVFDVAAITDGENAVSVLGQTTYTAGTSGLTQGKFNFNNNVVVGLTYRESDSRLFVGDGNNRRVLVFDVAAITNGENAVNVLGQANFTTNTGVYTQSSTYLPQGMALGGNYLFAADATGRRIMVFDIASITDGENAVNLLGQTNGLSLTDPAPLYTASGADALTNRWGYNTPRGMTLDSSNHRLFVVDGLNNRVLVYELNSSNQLVDRLPDYVLGQSDFNGSLAATTESGLNSPTFVAYDSTNQRLFVSQATSNRVSVFDVASITNGEAAVNVLGQADFTSSGAAVTQAGMSNPQGIAYDASKQLLYVAQLLGNRVSVFDVASITNGENAVNVLGQPDFTSSGSATTQAGLNLPVGVALDITNQRLFVGQAGANRVSVFDVASITNGENAVNVLGQPDFTSSGAATTQAGLNNPLGLEYDTLNQRLFVAQGGGNRVTVYSVAAITNGENAVNVLGQADFTSSGSATTQAGLNNPIGLVYNESTSEVYVSQTTNGNRVSVFDAAVVGFTKNKTSVNASEGQTTPPTFTLVLTGAPTTDVVLNISVDNTTSISVSPATLTFTNSNWSTPQTVTVTALEDENLVVDNGTITISVDPAQSDDAFDDVLNQTITVTAFDNDRPPQAGGGGSSGPPPVTPTTPLVPDLITPPPSESPEDEDEANAEEDVGELEEQPAVCVIPQYPTAFIKFGSKNDTEQVKLLEQFLNLFMGADLAVDGIYDSKDRQVVIALQERYQEEILAPWKLKQGTGYVYIKTLAKIKLLVESRCR